MPPVRKAKLATFGKAVSAALVLGACSVEASSQSSGQRSQSSPASYLLLCKNCPSFAKVPDPPASLRPIRYVSAFELTWNNYLAAYDEGACSFPSLSIAQRLVESKNGLPRLEKFRIDWPITNLGVREIECYINWLQRKTHYRVALPKSDEWEWFARGGRARAKFPWGNNPDATKEALGRANIPARSRTPWSFEDGGRVVNPYLSGVKVGLFPPNNWGLHDVMGNVRELTSETISGEDFLRRNPKSRLALQLRDQPRVTLKGSAWWVDPDWAAEGIDQERYAVLSGGRYSTNVGIRLILIERGRGQ